LVTQDGQVAQILTDFLEVGGWRTLGLWGVQVIRDLDGLVKCWCLRGQ